VIPALLTEDHMGFVVERNFAHKVTIGYPSMDKAWFIPGTKTRLVVLWLRIENLSANPLKLDVEKFSCTDDAGKMYSTLSPQDAYDRIMAGVSVTDAVLATKTLNRLSLGRAGNKVTPEQIKEDIQRYSLQNGTISGRGIQEGLIYFEAPRKKKFTLDVSLLISGPSRSRFPHLKRNRRHARRRGLHASVQFQTENFFWSFITTINPSFTSHSFPTY